MSSSVKADFDSAMVALQKDQERLKEGIAWIAQTVHQGHHEGPVTECSKNTCAHARALLRGDARYFEGGKR